MYNRILVPLDGSKLAECVLPHVEALGKGCSVKEVILFRACQPPAILADYPDGMPTGWEQQAKQVTKHLEKQCAVYLDTVEKDLKDAGLNVRTEVFLGDPADTIADFAKKNEVDLIIMATHGRSGPSRWAYGSTADKVLRSGCTPVLIVRGPGCVPGL